MRYCVSSSNGLGGVSLAANEYEDIVTLTVNSCACLYVVCFISKLIEKHYLGAVIAKIGKESFYIMALHFIGFKIGSLLLLIIGQERNLAELCPSVGTNLLLLMFYMIFGVGIPLLIIVSLRKVRMVLRKIYGL